MYRDKEKQLPSQRLTNPPFHGTTSTLSTSIHSGLWTTTCAASVAAACTNDIDNFLFLPTILLNAQICLQHAFLSPRNVLVDGFNDRPMLDKLRAILVSTFIKSQFYIKLIESSQLRGLYIFPLIFLKKLTNHHFTSQNKPRVSCHTHSSWCSTSSTPIET